MSWLRRRSRVFITGVKSRFPMNLGRTLAFAMASSKESSNLKNSSRNAGYRTKTSGVMKYLITDLRKTYRYISLRNIYTTWHIINIAKCHDMSRICIPMAISMYDYKECTVTKMLTLREKLNNSTESLFALLISSSIDSFIMFDIDNTNSDLRWLIDLIISRWMVDP